MSYFQSENYKNLIENVPFSKVLSLTEQNVIAVFIKSGNWLKHFFTRRILIQDIDSKCKVSDIDFYLTKINQDIKNQKVYPIYTEFRFHHEKPIILPGGGIFHKISINKIDHYNILIDTTQDLTTLFRNLDSSKRRQVNSSLKKSVQVKEAESEKEVKAFYKILKELYRLKVMKPLYPLSFFLEFFRNKENGVIFVAKESNKVIGGICCPVFKHKVMYEWFIAGLDKEYKGTGIFPSVLLTWEAIKYAHEHGFETFNFLGAGPQNQEYGVRRFKSQFGGMLIESLRIQIIHRPFLYKLGTLAIKFGLGSN